jgi:hypothetical protein
MDRPFAIAALAVADLVAMIQLRPRVPALFGHLSAPDRWIAEVGPDRALGAVVGAALWLAAVWLAVGLLAAALARLPGSVGRCAGRLGRILLPRIVHRLVIGSAGLGLLLAPAAAGASPAAPSGPATASAAPRLPTPVWPIGPLSSAADRGTGGSRLVPVDDGRAGASATGTGRTSVPVPAWPTFDASPPLPRSAAPLQANRAPASRASHGGQVSVRPGDSLWLIAARRLGAHASAAQIADAWPRWYSRNEAVIGDDPALIRPGQILHALSPRSSSPNTEQPRP